MSVVCCGLDSFCADRHGMDPVWKWGRLSTKDTYVIIFSKNQKKVWDAFAKCKHEVNVLSVIEGCSNVVHPMQSSNTIVVFERAEKMGPPKPRKPRVRKVVDVTRSTVQAVPPVPF